MNARILFPLHAAILVFVIFAAALAPSIATAQQGGFEPTGEFGLDVLYALSTDVDFNGGSTLDIEDDIGVALIFGYRFTPRFELHFSLDWNNWDFNGTLQSVDFPALSADVRGEMESFTPRVNALFNFRDAPLTPYVTGGIGWAFIDTNIPTGQVQVGCWWDPWWGQICTPYQPTRSIDEFTYQAGLGLRWDATEYFTMRLAYEKKWLDLSEANGTPDLDSFKVGFVYRY